jgi:uncharacterized protein C19orf52
MSNFARFVYRPIFNYITNLVNDYKATLIEIKDKSLKRPFGTGCLIGFMGFLFHLSNNNPNEVSFLDQLITAQNNLITVGESVRNPSSSEHIFFLNQCIRERTLTRLDLCILSLMFRNDIDQDCALFLNSCNYLKPSNFNYLTERIIDIGFAGKWRIMELKMVDFDVNPQEWS